jgi:hypothetical protein
MMHDQLPLTLTLAAACVLCALLLINRAFVPIAALLRIVSGFLLALVLLGAAVILLSFAAIQ